MRVAAEGRDDDPNHRELAAVVCELARSQGRRGVTRNRGVKQKDGQHGRHTQGDYQPRRTACGHDFSLASRLRTGRLRTRRL